MNNSEESSNKPVSNQLGTSALLLNNPLLDETNNQDTDRKTSDLTDEFQSESIIPDEANNPSKGSITPGRLTDESTPNIGDVSSNNANHAPRRSASESVLPAHHESNQPLSTLPVQQDESSSDDENPSSNRTGANNTSTAIESSRHEDENQTNRTFSSTSARSKTGANGSKERRSSTTKHDILDETTNFTVASKTPSASSKRSQRAATDDNHMNRNGTNQRVTSAHSSKSSSDVASKRTQKPLVGEQVAPSNLENEPSMTDEQSKLIKPGEKLQLPTNDIDNERANSPPPVASPLQQMFTANPLLGGTLTETDQGHSEPTGETKRKSSTSSATNNEKAVDDDIVAPKSKRSSNASQQQKPKSSSSKRASMTSEQKSHTRQNSTDQQDKQPSSKATSRKTSAATGEQAISVQNSQQENEKRLSTTDSEKLRRADSTSKREKSHHSAVKKTTSSASATPKETDQALQGTGQPNITPLQLTEDENASSRPQSPTIGQIAEHNPVVAKNKNQNEEKKKEQRRSLHKSNSAESLNYIRVVDGESIGSASEANTASERKKQQRTKSKTVDVQTNTDQRTDARRTIKKQPESTNQKPLKATKQISDQSSRHRTIAADQTSSTTPDTDRDTRARRNRRTNKKANEDSEPVNVNVTVLVKNAAKPEKSPQKQTAIQGSAEFERHTQSDTEQIITEKQKKRRRPKRISRTTQTYECVFRRMEREEHEELLPTNDTDKNIQTRKSQLCPTTKSPRRHYPIYISADAFKVEELLPKQFPQNQRNASKTAMVARSISPQNGKILILRPTLPLHHADAVNVQRVCLQYAIDLIPSDNKRSDSPYAQRNKTHALKPPEQTNNLPMIHSSASSLGGKATSKPNMKDKTTSHKADDRSHQRKAGGAV